MKNPLILLARLAPALALLSCAAPKAVVVEAAPISKKHKLPETVAAPDPAANTLPDDGIRLPDMLALPGEKELSPTRPATMGGGGSGAVIARPPTE